jgi:polysaccharide deacetylase family protein (PEP-CTERM system associated)
MEVLEQQTSALARRGPPVRHFFTVDVEEYFQVNAFEDVIPRDEWSNWPSRLEHATGTLLELLERRRTTGTFFVLGWIAERSPHVVRQIASAGHEVASHGYWHRRAFKMSRDEFREDVRASKAVLEDIIGRTVIGFRAPSFSITPGAEWTFDVLLEEGYRYDSSLFPVRRRGYGYPTAPRDAHLLRRSTGTLVEFPMATARLAGISIPAAGGGYLRQLPFALIRRAFRQAEGRSQAATFYIHPWEIDADQPRVPVSMLTRVRHYRGLARTLERVDRILDSFRFGAIGPALANAVQALAAAP